MDKEFTKQDMIDFGYWVYYNYNEIDPRDTPGEIFGQWGKSRESKSVNIANEFMEKKIERN